MSSSSSEPERDLPKVHAVVVHHRGREMVGAALETLLQSSGVELRVTLVLNGCDEELPTIANTSELVRIVETPEPTGFSEANNFGVAAARSAAGEPNYWYFVNNDTRHTPDAVRLQVEALRARPRAAVAGPRLMIDGHENHLNSLGINVTDDGWGWDEGIGLSLAEYGPLPGTREVLAVTGSALLVEAGAFEAVGGWTELYGYYFEDIDLCLKVRSGGREVLNVPEAIVHHRISATAGVASDRKWYLFRRNRLLLVLIHWPFWRAVAVARGVRAEIGRTEGGNRDPLRRAWNDARAEWDRVVEARRSAAGSGDWSRFLRAAGSVPVIELPGGQEDGEEKERLAAIERFLQEIPSGGRPSGRNLVLVYGWGPFPGERARMNYAPGGRSWQLVTAIRGAGQRCVFVGADIPGTREPLTVPEWESSEDGDLVTVRLPLDLLESDLWPEVAARLTDRLEADAVVGAGLVPATWANEGVGDLPFWVDFFGDPIAEAQARSRTAETLDPLTAYFDKLVPLLLRGDRFSAVSVRQSYALLGQLGLAGRLNRWNLELGLVSVIPVGAGTREEGEAPPEPWQDPTGVVRSEDLVVLWSGGFNTWCDVPVLVDGLARAMREQPRLRFVVTGGRIEGHDDVSYSELQRGLGTAHLEDRCRLLGSLPPPELDRVLQRADVCLVTERRIPERLLGSSGRIVEWMARGQALVCTELSELGGLIGSQELGWTYEPGSAADLARVLLAALENPGERQRRGNRARKHALGFWTPSASCDRFGEFAAGPGRSPDRHEGSARACGLRTPELARLEEDVPRLRERLAELEGRYSATAAELESTMRRLARAEDRFHGLRAELGRIHQSRMWRIWTSYHRLFRARSRSGASSPEL